MEGLRESISAFLIIIGIPLSYSIADGLALGFIRLCYNQSFQWSRPRNQLADLHARGCAGVVLRFCA
jgi:xanthine/uracil/vitamin C permease (AzgA family)